MNRPHSMNFISYLIMFAFAYGLSTKSCLEKINQSSSITDSGSHLTSATNSNVLFNPHIQNMSVNFTCDFQKYGVVIKGTVLWQFINDTPPDQDIEVIIKALTSTVDDSCYQNFAVYHRILQKTRTSFEIPHLAYGTIRHILTVGCSYEIKMNTVKHEDCPFVYTFTPEVCDDDTSLCKYCLDITCRCKQPTLPSPINLNYTIDKDHDYQHSSLIHAIITWAYEPNIIGVENFKMLSYMTNVESSHNAVKVVDQLISYTSEVAANGSEYCSDALKVVFTVDGTTYDFQSTTNSSSIILEIILSATSVVFISLGGCIYVWKKRLTHGSRIHLKTLQRHRVQYHSSGSSKSSCLTRSTYLSTEREDLNVLYVEQEIQEARDKGIVDFYEISYGRLTIGEEIGKGAFGRVCIATAEAIASTPGKITVAVKYLKDSANDQEKQDFLAEIAMMKKAGHHLNVVAMVGCCTMQQPYCMVMEYLAGGDLLNYLRKLRQEYVKLTGEMQGLSFNEHFVADKKLISDSGKNQNLNQCTWTNDKTSVNLSFQQLLPTSKTESQLSALYGCQNEALLGESNDNFQKSFEDKSNLSSRGDNSSSSKATEETSLLISGESVQCQTPSSQQNLNISIDPLELQHFALQIAQGMSHLASRGIVHRDLAARNILMDQHKHLKVADFGLSRRGVYVTHKGGRVPLRWLSIEAIRDNLYSTQSDVWAFGIVLWEICTLGGFPYATISDKDLYRHLLYNNRLERPLHCSEDLYQLMTSCWRTNPGSRPTFDELCNILEEMGKQQHTYVNFDSSNKTELPPTQDLMRHTQSINSE